MKPLHGVRILEIDGLGPITFAGMMLADLGADVIRLTRAGGGGVFEDVGGAVMHRGRAASPVDMKSPEGRAAVLELVEQADALVEGFRPGVMERLGLGPDDCQARNPRLVYARVTGWGQHGPMANEVGHDINYLALSGTLHALGEPGKPPRPPLNLVADYAGGAMPVVIGLLAGVTQARATGRGTVVDAAMVDGAGLLSALFQGLAAKGLWSDRPGTNLLDGGAPFYRCFACADGRFVAVGRWSRASMRRCWRGWRFRRTKRHSMTWRAGRPCTPGWRPPSPRAHATTGRRRSPGPRPASRRC